MGLKELCAKVMTQVRWGAPKNPEFPNSNGWTITLFYKRHQLTVPFYTGYGIKGEPTAIDVLSCLLSDSNSADQDFDSWCQDLGYDSDSRKAERIYKACESISCKLHKFLGEDYETFLSADPN
jgi:hypothetical protein